MNVDFLPIWYSNSVSELYSVATSDWVRRVASQTLAELALYAVARKYMYNSVWTCAVCSGQRIPYIYIHVQQTVSELVLYTVAREYHLYNKLCQNLHCHQWPENTATSSVWTVCSSQRIPHVQQTMSELVLYAVAREYHMYNKLYMSELYAVAREYHITNKPCLIMCCTQWPG